MPPPQDASEQTSATAASGGRSGAERAKPCARIHRVLGIAQHGDLEQLRGLLGHARIETTQLYAQIRPTALKQAVEFYEAKALDVLTRRVLRV